MSHKRSPSSMWVPPTPNWRAETRALLTERDGPRCHWCGRETVESWTTPKVPDNRRTIDHLIRRRDGGSHDLDNLVLACRRCNTERD
jgi:5-methylcytosine-specific restriction endonuclease McrA